MSAPHTSASRYVLDYIDILRVKACGVRPSERPNEVAVAGDVAVRHVRGVERNGGIAIAVDKNQATCRMCAVGELTDARIGNSARNRSGIATMRRERVRIGQQIDRHLAHHNLHDAFAIPRAGNAARLSVGVATAADQRRIPHATRMFACRATCRSTSDEIARRIECNGTNCASWGRRRIVGCCHRFHALFPRSASARRDEFFGRAKRHAALSGELFRPFADQHHVFGFFQDEPSELNWIAHVLDCRDGAGLERDAVHQDRIELNPAVAIQMRAVACVEQGIVLERDNCSLHRVNRSIASRQHLPSGFERLANAAQTIISDIFREVSGAAMNNERRSQFCGCRVWLVAAAASGASEDLRMGPVRIIV
jgi:hypothetical protein